MQRLSEANAFTSELGRAEKDAGHECNAERVKRTVSAWKAHFGQDKFTNPLFFLNRFRLRKEESTKLPRRTKSEDKEEAVEEEEDDKDEEEDEEAEDDPDLTVTNSDLTSEPIPVDSRFDRCLSLGNANASAFESLADFHSLLGSSSLASKLLNRPFSIHTVAPPLPVECDEDVRIFNSSNLQKCTNPFLLKLGRADQVSSTKSSRMATTKSWTVASVICR
jgi:hypothetical protein